ncbi:catabolic L-serine/threonine dehydratase [Saxophila tyrrhenica]|uniref:L-serine ammonia-lyase n=1 Tax=Saxophila tyrrhenica TaxID=1690608 RepID=A0AAV9PMN9_9PEZI|nr:catabolic L-serine/threonine dehydratase [Saxophila tyrrhenica]
MAIKDKKPWNTTPLIESSVLSESAGCRIFLKLETLQPGGSFKSRGIANFCLRALKRSPCPDRVHFYSNSGGNAGIAAVHAANFLGRPCTVVVPVTTSDVMVAKIKAAGAQEVVQYGCGLRESETYLREVVMKKAEARGEEGVHVMPYDHQDIWDGNATMIEEVREQMEGMGEQAPEVVACSVGGGGMLNGVLQAMENLEAEGADGWERTQVLAMETLGADSLASSLERGEHSTLPGITSQAKTLGAVRVSDRTYELASRHQASGKVKSAVFTDAEAAMGCWRFADDERIMVELSCGVTVALCYGGRLERALGRPVRPDDKVVLIVCGGHGVTLGMIDQWKREFGDVDADVSMGGNDDSVPSAVTAHDDMKTSGYTNGALNEWTPPQTPPDTGYLEDGNVPSAMTAPVAA